MEDAVEELEKINQSPEERYLYLRRQMALSDEATQRNYWTKVGEKTGEERAAARIKKAEAKTTEAEAKVAKAERIAKEEKLKIAKQLLGKLSIEPISDTVGLSVAELNELKK